MSQKNLDKHNRFRSKSVVFRVSPEEAEELNRAVAITCIMHRKTDVLQGNANLKVFILASNILNTCVNSKASSVGIGDTFVNHLDRDTTFNEVVERLGIMQSDIGKGRTESTKTTFWLIHRGDHNVAKVLGEERNGNDTEIFFLA